MSASPRPSGLSAVPVLFLVALSILPNAALATEKNYPEDPFAYDRELLPATEVGTVPGQVQVTALAALISGDSSDENYVGGQIGIEFMMNEFASLRISNFQEICETDGAGLSHKLSSLRFGSALHFNPYNRFDYGSFIEGGVTTVNAIEGEGGKKAPDVAVGGFLTYHVDSALIIRAELSRAWTNVEIDKATVAQNRTAGLLGFGIAF